MDRYTKGPWHVGVGNGEGSIFADEGRSRLELGGTALYPICQINNGWNDAEDAANARLIAASPEMYDALKDLITYLGVDVDNGLDELLTNARAVIAKATGEQS